MRQAIAPLFMLMKQTPPQLPVWEYSDRILGAFNDQEASQGLRGPRRASTCRSARTWASRAGSFEVVIVDEDAKINVNMGASNEIAHIRLAKQLMSAMAPIQYDPLFEQRDSTGNYNDRLTICSAIIDWADPDEQLFSCDIDERALVERGRGSLVPAPGQAVPPQERAVRLARGAAHGPRHHRRLLGDVRRPRPDRSEEAR